ncbi:hypothetical protein Lfu02_48140 [Longispora fulva]|uniref:Putative membrane protein YhhN n=2 Tax=Longispora fulva TaxID=619741 RepID=A0A8J7GIM1_9ACTN|nr:DUF2631 domain-containing protein [Longispora fulva]MBG6138190.1 putative membrane protein YhhN [Longispora fulva]GIG60442.1 hypothetical protein Lfu02_48140 [Longispora fulva]
MAGSSEPVTSPDQHKPTNMKVARIGGIVTILVLLVMTIGNHEGNVENVWLIGLAALLAATLVGDWLLRKNGLKSN